MNNALRYQHRATRDGGRDCRHSPVAKLRLAKTHSKAGGPATAGKFRIPETISRSKQAISGSTKREYNRFQRYARSLSAFARKTMTRRHKKIFEKLQEKNRQDRAESAAVTRRLKNMSDEELKKLYEIINELKGKKVG